MSKEVDSLAREDLFVESLRMAQLRLLGSLHSFCNGFIEGSFTLHKAVPENFAISAYDHGCGEVFDLVGTQSLPSPHCDFPCHPMLLEKRVGLRVFTSAFRGDPEEDNFLVTFIFFSDLHEVLGCARARASPVCKKLKNLNFALQFFVCRGLGVLTSANPRGAFYFGRFRAFGE